MHKPSTLDLNVRYSDSVTAYILSRRVKKLFPSLLMIY